jgi:23S rRNA 5-hydroxycytidine C2501 synthase
MQQKRSIELLAPAKNLECGLAAISHGADAVYIGGPKFGAREAVGNSVLDIEKLASEAHLFGAKVYVALNTILYDNELEPARKIIEAVYEAGADALIIQDMGLLEMDLPPIPLHASTQVHNYSPEKIEFLEAVGFKRAVLARELTLDQIHEVSNRTTIELEAFVHGSLCVSMSGQCYLSHAIGGRSANRGACAQPCRKRYSLIDEKGKILLEDKHLLSLQDLDYSASIGELAEAGICSFKIEGRLKDIDYVKNITSFYRKKIDAFLEEKPEYHSTSHGKTYVGFDPDPHKSFNRGSTNYFLNGRQKGITSFDTPKSLGEEAGTVILAEQDFFELETQLELSNNDGLVFISASGETTGLKINYVLGNRIFPDKMNGIYAGARVYRNYDHKFREKLKADLTIRKIRVELYLEEISQGFSLRAMDESGKVVTAQFECEKQPAREIGKSKDAIVRQMTKTGGTVFEVIKTDTGGNEKYFFQSAVLNSMRRDVLEKLSSLRMQKPHFIYLREKNSSPFPAKEWGYQANVSNQLARRFYQRHGVKDPGKAFELLANHHGLTVMTTKHCLKYQLGYCTKYDKTNLQQLSEPLFLIDGTHKLCLEFDCPNCQMKVLF